MCLRLHGQGVKLEGKVLFVAFVAVAREEHDLTLGFEAGRGQLLCLWVNSYFNIRFVV